MKITLENTDKILYLQSSGGEPATPDEIEIIKVTVINGDGIDMTDEQWRDRAQDWLDDKGYDAARDRAREDREMDRDFGGDDF